MPDIGGGKGAQNAGSDLQLHIPRGIDADQHPLVNVRSCADFVVRNEAPDHLFVEDDGLVLFHFDPTARV